MQNARRTDKIGPFTGGPKKCGFGRFGAAVAAEGVAYASIGQLQQP
jgi:hypothetical protein